MRQGLQIERQSSALKANNEKTEREAAMHQIMAIAPPDAKSSHKALHERRILLDARRLIMDPQKIASAGARR
jgi:hypothetical protein